MTDLWIEASRDETQERLDEVERTAHLALAPKLSFVMGASSLDEFEDRLAVIAEEVERVVRTAAAHEPACFPIVHESVLSDWRRGFQDLMNFRASKTAGDDYDGLPADSSDFYYDYGHDPDDPDSHKGGGDYPFTVTMACPTHGQQTITITRGDQTPRCSKCGQRLASRRTAGDRTVLSDSEISAAREIDATSLGTGDRVFQPSTGTIFRSTADGRVGFPDMGFAPIDGSVWVVESINGNSVTGRWESGVNAGKSMTATIPPGQKVIRLAHHQSSRRTALAPFPTATVEVRPGEFVTVYASPSSTGQPKNAWIAAERRPDGTYLEWFGGATRESVARRAQGGPWIIVETGRWEWTPTPARKLLGSRKTAGDKCTWLVEVPTASLYPPEAEWYPDSAEDVYTTVECGGDVTYDAGGWTCSNGHNHRTYGGPEHQEYWDEDEIAAGRNRFGRKTASLFDEANAAYERQDQAWFDALSKEDLLTLWNAVSGKNFATGSMTYGWDDEVYEALYSKGHFASRKTASVGQVVRDSGWSAPLKDSLDGPSAPRTRTMAVDALGKGAGNLLVTLTFDWPTYEIRVDPYPGKVVASGQTSSLGVIESAAMDWIKKNVTSEWYGKSRDDAVAAVSSRKRASDMFSPSAPEHFKRDWAKFTDALAPYAKEGTDPDGTTFSYLVGAPEDLTRPYKGLTEMGYANGWLASRKTAGHVVIQRGTMSITAGPFTSKLEADKAAEYLNALYGFPPGSNYVATFLGGDDSPGQTYEEWRGRTASRKTAGSPTFEVISSEASEHLACTVVRSGGKAHWAITSIDGEREYASGSHDNAETARRVSSGLLRRLEAKYVWVDDEDDKKDEDPKAQPQDAQQDPAPTDAPPQDDAQPQDAQQNSQPPVEDQAKSEAPVKGQPEVPQPEVPHAQQDLQPQPDAQPADPSVTDTAPEAQDGTAEETDQVDDPMSMQVGQTTTMAYNMASGGAGAVEVTFVREDNGVYYFNGPTGEFGVANREGKWIDAAANEFTFGASAGASNEMQGQVGGPPKSEQAPDSGQKPSDSDSASPKSDSTPKDDSGDGSEDKKPDDEKDSKKKDNPPWAKKSALVQPTATTTSSMSSGYMSFNGGRS